MSSGENARNDKAGTSGGSGGSYVPPHLRNIAPGARTPAPSHSAPTFTNDRPGDSGSRWGGPRQGYGGGGRRGSGRGREQEVNPFDNDDIDDGAEAANPQESTGINFDAYEDIPVEIRGDNVPPPVNTFAEIDLGAVLNLNIKRCKYVKPTPVQRHAIPICLAGRDLMACAQTGSGKTAAFCFPIISGIMKGNNPQRPDGVQTLYPFALILAPTRELSMQILEEAKKFSYQTGVRVVVVYGGTPILHQLWELEKGVDILVATPGRLVDLLERSKVSFQMIRYLALDEADRMLNMGFEHQIRKIVQEMDMPGPGERQTMLFSATFPKEIQSLASDLLSNYIFLAVGRVGSSTDLIVQRVELVQDNDKRSNLMDVLQAEKANQIDGKQARTLVFVETKRRADSLEYWLSLNQFPATAIHGDRSQQQREQALSSFKRGVTPILVATDVASRGLHIPHVAHVINYDLPSDIDDYVHRIGRTGRAGNTGLATAFFNQSNMSLAKALADLMQEANQAVPDWLTRYANANASHGGGRGRRSGGGDFRRDYSSFGRGRSGGSGSSGGGYGSSSGGGYGGSSGGGYGGSSGGSAWDS